MKKIPPVKAPPVAGRFPDQDSYAENFLHCLNAAIRDGCAMLAISECGTGGGYCFDWDDEGLLTHPLTKLVYVVRPDYEPTTYADAFSRECPDLTPDVLRNIQEQHPYTDFFDPDEADIGYLFETLEDARHYCETA